MFSVMARVCVDDEVHGVEVLSSPKKVVVIIFVRGSAKVRLREDTKKERSGVEISCTVTIPPLQAEAQNG